MVISSTTVGALTFNTPAGMSITASGNISGSGSGGLTMAGAGLLTLSGSNSFSGTTTVNAGNSGVRLSFRRFQQQQHPDQQPLAR